MKELIKTAFWGIEKRIDDGIKFIKEINKKHKLLVNTPKDQNEDQDSLQLNFDIHHVALDASGKK